MRLKKSDLNMMNGKCRTIKSHHTQPLEGKEEEFTIMEINYLKQN